MLAHWSSLENAHATRTDVVVEDAHLREIEKKLPGDFGPDNRAGIDGASTEEDIEDIEPTQE